MNKHDYFIILIYYAVFTFIGCTPKAIDPITPDLKKEWVTAKPASFGVDADQLKNAHNAAKEIPRFKSLLVIKDGHLIFEEYYHKNKKGNLNDVRSVTKTVVSTLVGIALKEGFITSLDETIGDYLDTTQFAVPVRQRGITLRNLLTMKGGFEWVENTGNEYNEWITSEDHLAYIFDKQLTNTPGAQFNYNSGAVHLLGVIVEQAVGMKLEAFADQYLFQKIGIEDKEWETLSGGFVNGGSGFDLYPRDMARLGQLFLQNGQNAGEQILPSDWVSEATNPDWIANSEYGVMTGLNYGFLWWLNQDNQHPAYLAWGYGGQFIYVVPDLHLVVVTTTDWVELSLDIGSNALTKSVLEVIVNQVIPAVD